MRSKLAPVFVLALILGNLAGPASGDDLPRPTIPEGSRGRALGGAFIAIAEGGAAPLWNPAGLGFATQSELLWGRSSFSQERAGANLMGFVMPFRELGVGAVTIQHSLFDPIASETDPANRIYKETHLLLSYASRVGNPWSVGGSISYVYLNLADEHADGWGMNLGASLRPGLFSGAPDWLEDSAAGLALENAVEPHFTLETSTGTDPLVLGLGLAKGFQNWNWVRPLFVFDTRISRGQEVRFHAGVEMEIDPRLALRLGTHDGSPSAGFGVNWKQFALDYSWEDASQATAHRVGVAWHFGNGVGGRHNESIQDRLAMTYQDSNSNRIDSLISEIESSIEQDGPLEHLDTALMLHAAMPEDARAAALAAFAWRQLGSEQETAGEPAMAALSYSRALAIDPEDSLALSGRQRARAESNRQAARTGHVQIVFSVALDAFAAGDLVKARAAFTQLLAKSPKDEEAARMLERIEEQVSGRASRLVKEARVAVTEGRYEDAAKFVKEVMLLDSSEPGLGAIVLDLSRVNRERAQPHASAGPSLARSTESNVGSGSANVAKDQSAPVRLPKPTAEAADAAPEVTEQTSNEIERLARLGGTAKNRGLFDAAIGYWQAILSLDPNHEPTKGLLKEEYYLEGLDAFSTGRLEESIQLWELALELDPEDRRASAYIDRATRYLESLQEVSKR